MIAKRKIRPENKRYYDFKQPSFPDCLPPSEFSNSIKLERFETIAEHLGFGYVIIVHVDGRVYSIEGERIMFNDTIKRKDSGFVEVEPTEYVNNSKYNISMNGSYYHGFHYFRTKKAAMEIAEKLFTYFDTEIVEASIYSSNARGTMLGVETHCTAELYLHEEL